MSPAAVPATPADNNALRRRVAPLCHGIRLCAVIWMGWASAATLSIFASKTEVAEYYGRFFHVDLTNLPVPGYAMALAIIVLDLAIGWLPVVFVWRLFGHYLKGDIFSLAAVREMWLCGWSAVAAVVTDILARPLLAYALSRHLSEGERLHFWTNPNDLLHLLTALLIVAFAHIFRAGVEIADDNRQIV